MDIDSILKGHGIGVGGSNIKSIQRGVASLNGTSLSIPISNVDLTKAIVLIGFSSLSSTGAANQIQAKFSDSTHILLSIFQTTTVPVSWQVIEFNNVKSLQYGTSSVVGVANSTSISNINLDKSILFYTWTTTASTATASTVRGELASSTTITFNQDGFNPTYEISWFVIEFN